MAKSVGTAPCPHYQLAMTPLPEYFQARTSRQSIKRAAQQSVSGAGLQMTTLAKCTCEIQAKYMVHVVQNIANEITI